MVVFAKFDEKEMQFFIAYVDSHIGGRITENGKEVEFGNGRPVETGTQITLTAVANEGYNFLGWYFYNEQQAETLISGDATYTFTVNRELRVFAKFAEKEMYHFIANPTEAGYITENGKGVVLNEPSVVAIDKNNGKLLKVGAEAQAMLGRTPGNIVAIRPLREGVISDYDMTERMLKEFMRKVSGGSYFFKPRIIICQAPFSL